MQCKDINASVKVHTHCIQNTQ